MNELSTPARRDPGRSRSCACTCTASAPRARAGDAVVTVHIRDNVFEPASLRIAPGTTVRWVNEGHNRHDVKPNRGYAFGSGKLRPGQSYAHTFEDPGCVRVLLHDPRHSGRGAARRAHRRQGGRGGTGGCRSAAASAPAPTIPASGRTIRVPSDARDHPAGRRPDAPGRSRAGGTGCLPRERDRRDRRHRAARRRSQPHHPRRAVQARERREGRRRRWCGDREHDRAQLHRERVLLDRRARLPRLVPHRVPQRRLRHVRVRLAVGSVRQLLRVGQSRRGLLHRAVRSVPRAHHRRDRRAQPARVLGHELER